MQKTFRRLDDDGTGSFPGVRSKDARTRKNDYLDPPASEVFSVIQLCTINEPWFSNLKTLHLRGVQQRFISFGLLLLFPGSTPILLEFERDLPEATVASTVKALPVLYPNLYTIHLYSLPRDLMITAVVSGMLLATNRNTPITPCGFPVNRGCQRNA